MPIGPKFPRRSHAGAILDAPSTADLGRGSLDTLYRHHAPWLTGVLRRALGTLASDAEDLVQDAYVRIGRYSADDIARHPRALLRQIAVNLARDHMRRTVVRGRLAPLDDERRGVEVRLSTASTQESDLQLKHVLLALPPPYRDVFMLSRFTRMTNEDIAAHFAISVKTVEWRLSKALAFCARYFED